MAQSSFERAGGFATVRLVVSTFYDLVLDSPDLSPYFEQIEMRRLIDHQTRFISAVMGGPAAYTDDHLARVHAPLGISEAHFEEAVSLLREAMEDHGMQPADVDDVIREVRRREPSIVSAARPASA